MKFLITLLILQTITCAQATQEWVARYNWEDRNDWARCMVVDNSGSICVTGYSWGTGTKSDYATVKYSPNGVELWTARYNHSSGDSMDEANSVTVDNLGNVYVTGFSSGNGTYNDYATIKYNISGVQQWVQRYNGSGNNDDVAVSIAIDALGNVYVSGYSIGSGTNYDCATIKYNSSGAQLWVQRFNGPGNTSDIISALDIDDLGNVYVTGSKGFDYLTIKYNTMGVQQWVQIYNGPGNDYDAARSIAIDSSGNVYVTGYSYGTGTFSDYTTIKYNTTGAEQWVRRYNGTGNGLDDANSISVDGFGNAYVTGRSNGGTNYDYATIKYNTSGVQQWVQRYNGTGNNWDEAYSIDVDNWGNVYVTGTSWGNGTNYDYATVKYNSAGVQQWIERYSGLGNNGDQAESITVDAAGNVYVTGISGSSITNMDYATIKYSQIVGIHSNGDKIPNEFSLSQNYPNPFNPVTNFEFKIAKSGLVKLTIYDATGREVETLVNGELRPGIYKADWDAAKFVSGVYFYKLNAGDPSTGSGQVFTETKKMVLIK